MNLRIRFALVAVLCSQRLQISQSNDECEEKRKEIKNRVALAKAIVDAKDAADKVMVLAPRSAVAAAVRRAGNKAWQPGVTDAFKLSLDNLAGVLEQIACDVNFESNVELSEGYVRHVTKEAGKEVGRAISKELPNVLKKPDLIYPDYAAFDLCGEDCAETCRLDFAEIDWLSNPNPESLLDLPKTAIGKLFPGSTFLEEVHRDFLDEVFKEAITPPNKATSWIRWNELIEYASVVNSFCLGVCTAQQISQVNAGCCTYNFCDNTYKADTQGLCWVLVDPQEGSRYVTPTNKPPPTLGWPGEEPPEPNPNGCDIEGGADNTELHSCFFNIDEELCSVNRGPFGGFIAMDAAVYCHAEYTSGFWKDAVGYGATKFQNICTKDGGLQSTRDRRGSFCYLKEKKLGHIDNVDQAFLNRCPGRFNVQELSENQLADAKAQDLAAEYAQQYAD